MKKLILAITLVLLGFTTTFPLPAAAAPIDQACEGLKVADSSVNCASDAAKNSFSKIVTNIINILSVVVGAVSVIMIIVGGFRYIISNGDSNGVQGAKNTIIYAIIGLVVVLFAQIIVAFVLDNATASVSQAQSIRIAEVQ